MITIADNTRSAWLWALAVAGAVSVTGVVINIATDLKTSLLAWLAVAVATATGGLVAGAGQLTASGRRVHRAIVVVGVAGVVLAMILGILALVTLTPENAISTEATKKGPQSPTLGMPPTAIPSGTSRVEPGSPTAAPVRVIQSKASYKLVSSSDFCPASDKVDLDTAHSGYGGQPQLGDVLEGCRVEGGLAEMILEQRELHTPKNSQLLHLLGATEIADHDACRAALQESERLRSRITWDELRVGDHICVKSDQGNIALVTIVDMARQVESTITISFTTWG